MALVFAGVGLALFAALAGITLIFLRLVRRRMPRWLLAVHPVAGLTGLACLWVVFALWRGARDLPFDAGILALSFAFVAGIFLFSLRVTRLPRPFFAVALHGAAALFGCALLIVGLLRLGAGV
ncbi:MAG: hypothetical protein ACRES9_00665 [Gammaproteobacteria bacterium]